MSQNSPKIHDEKLAEISFKLMDAEKLFSANFSGFSEEHKERCIRANETLMPKLNDLLGRIKNDESVSMHELDELEREVDGYLELLTKSI